MATPDGASLFVQSFSTTLWKLTIGGTAPAVTLQRAWACTYNSTGVCRACVSVMDVGDAAIERRRRSRRRRRCPCLQ
jgi:hypothetical protein